MCLTFFVFTVITLSRCQDALTTTAIVFRAMNEWNKAPFTSDATLTIYPIIHSHMHTDSVQFPYALMSLRSAILTWQTWTKDTTRSFRLLFILHNIKRRHRVFHYKLQPPLCWWGMSPHHCQNKLGQERKYFDFLPSNDLSLNMKIVLICLTVHQWSTFSLRF